LKRTCSRVTSASSASGVLNGYALYKSTHSLTHSLTHRSKSHRPSRTASFNCKALLDPAYCIVYPNFALHNSNRDFSSRKFNALIITLPGKMIRAIIKWVGVKLGNRLWAVLTFPGPVCLEALLTSGGGAISPVTTTQSRRSRGRGRHASSLYVNSNRCSGVAVHPAQAAERAVQSRDNRHRQVPVDDVGGRLWSTPFSALPHGACSTFADDKVSVICHRGLCGS